MGVRIKKMTHVLWYTWPVFCSVVKGLTRQLCNIFTISSPLHLYFLQYININVLGKKFKIKIQTG